MQRGPARPHRPSMCGAGTRRKIRYRTLKDAKVARSFRVAGDAGYLRVYRCPSCQGYHLTSQPPLRTGSTLWAEPQRHLPPAA